MESLFCMQLEQSPKEYRKLDDSVAHISKVALHIGAGKEPANGQGIWPLFYFAFIYIQLMLL